MKWLHNFIAASILFLLVIPTAFLTLTGYFGQWNWLLDLTNHFRPVYVPVQMIGLIALLLMGRRRWAAVTAVFLLLNIAALAPLYLPPAMKVNEESILAEFRMVQFNICAPTRNYRKLTGFLKKEKPDLVVLEECADRCFSHLRRDGVLRKYPYQFRKSPLRHRLVVLSRFPMQAEPTPILHADPALALLRLKIQGRSVRLLVLHSTRPSSGAPYHANQIRQFGQIAALIRKSPEPFLMAGDFNTTPWAYSFRKLISDSGLRNSMDGFGLQASFPVFVPKMPKAATMPIVPIDHVLISRHFVVNARSTGPAAGSDHLPVIVDLGLKRDE